MKWIIASLLFVAVTGQFTDNNNSTEDRLIYKYSAEDLRNLVTMKLYSVENPDGIEIYPVNTDTEDLVHLNRPLKVFIHGYWSFGDKYHDAGITKNFLNPRYREPAPSDYDGEVNVIIVTWPSKTKRYGLAAYRAMDVGEVVADLLYPIVTRIWSEFNSYQCGDNLHLIGHSLGAQAVGRAGRLLRSWGCSPKRVTGLDPAGPKYEWGRTWTNSLRQRIDTDSGRFVDIIHTNPGVLGVKKEYGHVNFYVDGGKQTLAQFRGSKVPLYKNKLSHSYATTMFIDSILQPLKFPSKPCYRVQPTVDTYLLPICVPYSASKPYTPNYLGIQARPMEKRSYWTNLPLIEKREMEAALQIAQADGPDDSFMEESDE